ncbi:mCG147501 [Mus musculus]|uniref:Uncharacterized protein n=2 Tax=Mus TaxID=862507 RepID=Q8C325_MOUSE|nr:mCG147501 [Mus musculus]BAC39822.1 unnamed protein product [Mus musculus]
MALLYSAPDGRSVTWWSEGMCLFSFSCAALCGGRYGSVYLRSICAVGQRAWLCLPSMLCGLVTSWCLWLACAVCWRGQVYGWHGDLLVSVCLLPFVLHCLDLI